jgi:tol-pal system protein YbgF
LNRAFPHKLPWRPGSGALTFALVAATCLTGCGNAKVVKLERTVEQLREELSELRRTQAAQRVQFDRFRDRMVMVEDKVESQELAARRGPAPAASPARVAPQRPEVGPAAAPAAPKETAGGSRWIPPALPTVTIGPDGVVRRNGEEVAAVAPLPSAPPPVAASAKRPAVAPAGPSDPVTRRPPQADRPADPAAAAYRAARGQLKAGALIEARRAFEAMLQRWPRHQLADNAQYWHAETFYAQALWLQAARSFDKVVRDHPSGNKVPDAMVKTALCYRRLGDERAAREVLELVATRYAGTRPGVLARKLLSPGDGDRG